MHHQHRSPPSSCSAAQHSTAAHMPCALCEHHGCASTSITARRRVRHDRAASGAAMDRRGQTSKTRRLELFWGSYSSIGHARWMETERGGRPRGAQVVVVTIEPCDQGGEAVSARGTTARELRSHNPHPEYPRVETAIRTVTDPHGCPRDGRLLVQGRVRIACCHCFLVTHFDTQSTSAHAHLHSVSHDTSDLSQRVPHTFRRDATRARSHLGTWELLLHTHPNVA